MTCNSLLSDFVNFLDIGNAAISLLTGVTTFVHLTATKQEADFNVIGSVEESKRQCRFYQEMDRQDSNYKIYNKKDF